MTDIEALVAELRANGQNFRESVADWPIFDRAADALEAQAKELAVVKARCEDLHQARDAVSGALAHRIHETDPDMFFLAVKQMLGSARYLVDGYAPGAEEANR